MTNRIYHDICCFVQRMQTHFSEVFEYLNIFVCLYSFFRSLHSNDRTSLCLCIFPYHYEWTGCSRMLGLDVNSFSERLVFLLELSQQTTSQWNQSRRVTFFVRRCYVRSQGCQLMDWLIVMKGQVNSSSAVLTTRTSLKTINRADKKKKIAPWRD